MKINILGNSVVMEDKNTTVQYPIGSLKCINENNSLTIKHLGSRKVLYVLGLGDIEEPVVSDIDGAFTAVSNLLNGTPLN